MLNPVTLYFSICSFAGLQLRDFIFILKFLLPFSRTGT